MPKRVFAVDFSALDCERREASSEGGKRSEGGTRGESEGVGVGFEGVDVGLLVDSVSFSFVVDLEGAGGLESCV